MGNSCSFSEQSENKAKQAGMFDEIYIFNVVNVVLIEHPVCCKGRFQNTNVLTLFSG